MSEGSPHISTPMGQLHWNLWLAGLGTTAANRVIDAISKTHVLVPKSEIREGWLTITSHPTPPGQHEGPRRERWCASESPILEDDIPVIVAPRDVSDA